MKSKLILIFLILSFNNSLYSREIGQTEITAENGVEVFQDDKYYLIKQNVKIVSDDFSLNADEVKIFFRDDLYDIKIINAFGNVILISETNLIKAEGDELLFYLDDEKLNIIGNNSIFSNEDIVIKSDGKIIIENSSGKFEILGRNSSLNSKEILIKGNLINGKMNKLSNKNSIKELYVNDDNIAYIKNNEIEMFANIIKYDDQSSIIELENNVKIISKSETIVGDYGILDTKKNSYKVRSRDTNKVKVVITNNNE